MHKIRLNFPLRETPQIRRKALNPASYASLTTFLRATNKLAPSVLAGLLFVTSIPASATGLQGQNLPQINLLREFRPVGGTGNNLLHPALNAVPGRAELALAPLHFAPGTQDGLVSGPNPRTVSNVIAGGTGADGQNGQTTDPRASAWLYVFGQFVDHDLDLEQTPVDAPAINIVVPVGDPVFPAGTTIAMTRDTRDPTTNTIINTVAGYLDLSQLYGSTAAAAASLRNADGTLQSSDNGQAVPVVNDAFVTGDPRVMENPELTAVTILFMREHNFWVDRLKAQHPAWTGDQLYRMAKAITTAEYQNIIYQEYLPLLIGPVLGPYRGYDPRVNAQVTQEFSTAAFRVGHSQVSDTQEGLDNSGAVVFTESLAQAFFNTAAIDEANGIDPLLRSLGVDSAQATDVYVVAALRNLLVAGLVGGGVDRIDLIAIDIQRERDVGLATLNRTRRALGLSPYLSFAELTPDPVLQQSLQAVYGTIDQVDLFIGGLAEPPARGAIVGSTFQAIIAQQFEALRSGDRFFWLNEGFDAQTARLIGHTTLADILKRNTDTPILQANVFLAAPLPGHAQPHAVAPSLSDAQGRPKPAFLDDGK
ncbi:MAG: peroxidase family protein [Verrucomicrobia bacterium]|nr:peroxidase family protein [Verrucomicrobiota bacterium]